MLSQIGRRSRTPTYYCVWPRSLFINKTGTFAALGQVICRMLAPGRWLKDLAKVLAHGWLPSMAEDRRIILLGPELPSLLISDGHSIRVCAVPKWAASKLRLFPVSNSRSGCTVPVMTHKAGSYLSNIDLTSWAELSLRLTESFFR